MRVVAATPLSSTPDGPALDVELQVLAGLLDRRVLEDRAERGAHRRPVELGLAGGVPIGTYQATAWSQQKERRRACDHRSSEVVSVSSANLGPPERDRELVEIGGGGHER